MRIGVCLIGLSFLDVGKKRNWINSYQNILDTFGDVDYFLTTYKNDFSLLTKYKPKSYQILPFKGSTQRNTYIKALEKVTGVDFIITTRFDIHFHKKLSEMNIDYTLFNFLFKEKNTWDTHRFVTDNFFAFPIRYKSKFIRAIKSLDESKIKKQFMHHVYSPLSKTVDFHFISPKRQELSDNNSFYTLIRSQ